MIASNINTKGQVSIPYLRKLCTQQILEYYDILHGQIKLHISTMIEALLDDNKNNDNDQLIAILNQLSEPMKNYQLTVYDKAKSRITSILNKIVQNVINGALPNETDYYNSVKKKNDSLLISYKLTDKRNRAIETYTIKDLINFDIFACVFDQNKRFKKHCCQDSLLWTLNSLQKICTPTTLFQINKMLDLYEDVEKYVGFRRIWSEIINVWTLMLLKAKLLNTKKKSIQQCLKYLERRQKRQRQKIDQSYFQDKETIKKSLKFYLSQIVLFSYLKLDNLFPLYDLQLIRGMMHMIHIQQQQNTKKEHIIYLVLKYRTHLSHTISLFDAIIHKIGHQKAHFNQNIVINMPFLSEVFRYAFAVYDNYAQVISHLRLDKVYSLTIDLRTRTIRMPEKGVATCWYIAAKNMMRSYMDVIGCYATILKSIGPVFVFKRLDFSFSKIFGQQKLKKKKQALQDPKVILIMGTLDNKYVYSQIISEKLTYAKYLFAIKRFFKNYQLKTNFSLIIADNQQQFPFRWPNALSFYRYMLDIHNCLTFFSCTTSICSSIVVFYMHLQRYIRIFRRFITIENFQETIQYLIQGQLRKISQLF